MRRVLKFVLIVLGAIVAVCLVIVLGFYIVGGIQLNRTYTVEPASLSIPTGNPEAIAKGKHFAEAISLCTECHGPDLSGKVLSSDPVFGRLAPENLTSGEGGIGGTYSDADFVRAIRHGVDAKGHALPIMPSKYYQKLSGEDTAAIIAYVRSVPPVDKEVPESTLGVLGRILLVTGQLKGFFEYHDIDHGAAPPNAPTPGATAEYGKYLATVCTACHGTNLQGGPVPGDPEGAIAPNAVAAAQRWTDSEFMETLRTGTTPENKALDKEKMPWDDLGKMTDDELRAVYLYLKSLPAS